MKLKLLASVLVIAALATAVQAQTTKASMSSTSVKALPKFNSISGEIIIDEKCQDLYFNKDLPLSEMLKYTQIEVHNVAYQKGRKPDAGSFDFGTSSGNVPGQLIYSNLMLTATSSNRLTFTIVGFEPSNQVMLVCHLDSKMFNRDYQYTSSPLQVTSGDILKSKPVSFIVECNNIK